MNDLQPAEGSASWEELARKASARVSESRAPAGRELLCFLLDGSPYALPVQRLRQIVRMQPLIPMPRVPRCIRGVVLLRGQVLQVLDLRRRMGLPEADPDGRSRIIVADGDEDRLTGLLVDSVRAVLRTRKEDSQPVAEGNCVTELTQVGSEFVSVIDIDRVLAIDDLE